MAGTFNEDVEPDEDSPSFVENCLEEIRSKTLSTHLSKIASTKCDKAVLGMLVEAAVKRGDAVDDVLRTIFERLVGGGGGGSGGEDSENAEEIADKRLYVFRKGIELIQREGLLTSRSAGDLVTLLTFQLDHFPDESLFDLIEDFVGKIKSADISGEESVELFPKVLATLTAKLKLTTEEGKSETGSEYKSGVIKRVLAADWRPESVVRIVALCKDMDLKEEEEKKLVDKVVSRLGQIDAKDLPPVVYQLLLLAGKHGLQRLVLKGLADFFEERREEKEEEEEDEEDESEQVETRNIHSNNSTSRSNSKEACSDGKDAKSAQLQRAQGTVLMHVATAMRHSRQLSQEIIKYLKNLASTSSKRILRPFNVALALSLAKIPLYEETVFRLMKDSVFNCFRDAILTRSSDWLRDLLLNDSADDVLAASKATIKLLLRVVKAATSGWEHVLEQLVKFALILMEMAAAAAGGSGSSSSSPDWEHSPLIPPSLSEDSQSFAVKPEQLCGSAGSKMLLLLFVHHEEARFEIVEQLLNRLVIYAHNPAAGFVYAETLAKAANSAPFSLIESSNKRRIRETVEQLPSFAPALSKNVLSALMPVFKLSPSVRDDLLLVLRKCLFNRKSDSRKAAVNGFLLLLRNFTCAGSSDLSVSQMSQTYQFSQAGPSIETRFSGPDSSDGNMALCLELIQSLRRTFSHQADVRALVLEGLPSIVKRNDRLRDSVLDLLSGQFSTYVNQRGLEDEFGGPPLALGNCLQVTNNQSVVVTEPLGNLVRCCVGVLRVSREEKRDMEEEEELESATTSADLITTLNKLCLRLTKCEMDDFDLDKNSAINYTSTDGLKNLLSLTILLGVVEALIEFKSFQTTEEDVKVIVNLILFYGKIQDFVKDGLKAAEKGGGGKRKADDSDTGSQAGSTTSSGTSGPKPSVPSRTHSSTLSLECISRLLMDVCCSNSSSKKEEAADKVTRLLRAKHALVKHLFAVANQKVAQLTATGFCEGASNLTTSQLFLFIDHIGVSAWAKLTNPASLTQDAQSQIKAQEEDKSVKKGGQPFQLLLFETLSSVLTLVRDKFSKKHLKDLLRDLHAELVGADDGDGGGKASKSDPFSDSTTISDSCYAICKELQKQWNKIIRTKDSARKWSEVSALLHLVGQFHSFMDASSNKYRKILEWLDDVGEGEVIDDVGVVKRLFGIILGAKHKVLEKMYKVATDARVHMGEIEEDSVDEKSSEVNYQTINSKTVATVIIAALEKVSGILDDIQFVIVKLKAVIQESCENTSSSSKPRPNNDDDSDDESSSLNDTAQDQMRKSRESIIVTFTQIQKILGQLCFCKMPFGASVGNQVLKQTKKFYATAASFAEVYLAMCTKKPIALAASLVDSSFKNFLDRLHRKLQQNIHPFIFHCEDEKVENSGKGKKNVKLLQSKAVRDSSQIPSLIFAMETFDNAILSLIKVTRLDLPISIKNVARDFRINSDNVREVMEEEEAEEEEKENAGGRKGKRKAGEAKKTAKKMVKKRRVDEGVGDMTEMSTTGASCTARDAGMVTSTQKEASQGRKNSIGASGNVSTIETQD